MDLNIVVDNGFLRGDESNLFFSGEQTLPIKPTTDMFDLVVQVGLFKSKGQARKNWKTTGAEIPDGFTDLKGLGKMRHRITILKPTKDNLE